MEFNLIVAGVGGQGILTIAQAITQAALRRGLHVKQSEVHGMSQRGGAVQSHVRFADHVVHSELIPLGEADLIIAVEPLEALRYLSYLNPDTGAIVASSTALANIADYPPVEQTIARIRESARGGCAIVDAAKLTRQAGSTRAENVVVLGAAARFIPIPPAELLAVVDELFHSKGAAAIDANRKAFELGAASSTAHDGDPFLAARRSGRVQLFEHEVYQWIQQSGLARVPRYRLLRDDERIRSESELERFPGARVVIKGVADGLVHKSDRGAVAVATKSLDAVNAEIDRMRAALRSAGCAAHGVLLVEYVEHERPLGSEILVGIRQTREFGPIITAGFGGTLTEFVASIMRPGLANAIAPTFDLTGAEFLAMFKETAAYDLLSGRARGSRRLVGDEDLVRCFDGFIALSRQMPDLAEIEVNPFAVNDAELVALDGRGRFGKSPPPEPSRPRIQLDRLIEPQSIAIVGVSTKRANFGRIILGNILRSGFDPKRLFVIRDGVSEIDGVRCVSSLASLPEPVDLLVVATASDQLESIVRESFGRAQAVILISGGGRDDLRGLIHGARAAGQHAAVFVGPNCMGVQSRMGKYDTFFIPSHKLPASKHPDAPPRRVAIVAQSGAFVITRTSRLCHLDPAVCVSLGNQVDVTVSDVLGVLGTRNDIDCVGVYVEGLNDLDGLELIRAIRSARAAGKVVVCYKAGRTPAGRDAAAGHTASLAGDADVFACAVRRAGALMATTLEEFNDLLMVAGLCHAKRVRGARIGAISNAGFETVAMADSVKCGGGELPSLSDTTRRRIAAVLQSQRLSQLVTVANPLDLTPMAGDEAYEQCIGAMLDDPQIDAAIVGCVPMTPQLLTTPAEIEVPDSIATRLIRLSRESAKPLVVVVDAGEPYAAFCERLVAGGVPVLPSADRAFGSLATYLAGRVEPNTSTD